MDLLSDNRLMLKVKEGDLDQLGLLFERYHRILFKFFYNFHGNAALSEDQVQNVFERILKYRARFKGEGEFKAWMFFIARNINIDHYKKKKIKHTEDIDAWEDKIQNKELTTEAIMKQEELELLQEALQKLDQDKREILILSKLDGMPYKEIAALLGCTEGTVKVRVFRALQSLKKMYALLDDNNF
ncbi:MAG TPA: RNA polymerase sigma factor [Saprospiraceae bacterium]|nr:RNA polymerase sigma factor [Saprospiraceae bacterium]